MSSNELTGTIPKSFEEFPAVQFFDVYSNKLYGELPAFKDRLPAMSKLGIASNYFSGKIPESDINYGLDLFSNCFSEQELKPVLRQFLSQGRNITVSQRPSSECEAFLSQVTKSIASSTKSTTQVPTMIPLRDSTTPSNTSATTPNLTIIIGITSAIFLLIIIAVAFLLHRHRNHSRHETKLHIERDQITPDQKLDDPPPIPATDALSKQGLFDTLLADSLLENSAGDVKEGNLFRDIGMNQGEMAGLNVVTVVDDDSKSRGSGMLGLNALENQQGNGVSSSSGDARELGNILVWNPDQVASALASAGVNLGFIDIMRDHSVDGNQLVQLDHERLQEMGIEPFDARVLLLIAIGLVMEKNDVTEPHVANENNSGLHDNKHIGPVPDFVSTLTKLTAIDVRGNQLNGSIPDALSNLKTLKFLDLSYNELTGTIPKSFEEMPDVQYFNVAGNKLYGELPAFKDRLPAMSLIGIASNYFSGKIPESDINYGLSLSSNCFSDQDLQPVLRQFLSQGKTIDVSQKASADCEAFLSQVPKPVTVARTIIISGAPTATDNASSDSTTPSGTPSLALIIGVTSAVLLTIIIAIALLLRHYHLRRQRIKQLTEDQTTPNQKLGRDGLSSSAETTPIELLILPSQNLGDVKDGNLFKNLGVTDADAVLDDSSNSSGSRKLDLEGLERKQINGASSSANDSWESGNISSWNADQVASALASAGVNLGFIEILKDQRVDGNQLVQLDHERLQEMGIGPFDARVLLLIAIGMLKERHEGDMPPGYA
ncbi:hypothetical protein HDU97_004269 [Phlyctochytrium planicorne]|nr:hypothetical protein HDU97_004269 [Phlyctochytrium planicorne]